MLVKRYQIKSEMKLQSEKFFGAENLSSILEKSKVSKLGFGKYPGAALYLIFIKDVWGVYERHKLILCPL